MRGRLSPSARLAFIFLAFSTAWVLAGDALVHQHVFSPDAITFFQNIKGILFVLICTVIIYSVSRRLNRHLSQSLAETETLLHKYQALNEASKEGIIDYDIEKDTATINEQLKFFLGAHTTEITSWSAFFLQKIHPEDRERVKKQFSEVFASAATTWQSEYRFQWHDATYHDIMSKGCIVRDKKTGRACRFICTVQDLAEIREMQELIHRQQLQAKLQLGRSIIKAQEEERNRWAGELHDNVCQVLTVVKLYLTELASGRPLPPAVAQQPQVLVEKALNEIRQLSASIRPPEFETFSLKESLEQLVFSIRRVTSFDFGLQLDHLQEELLNDQHKLMIYRVVQEQVSNIIKYASPRHIHVQVQNEGEKVKVRIADDGNGFDPQKLVGGIGLRNIQSRLQVFNGSMNIESAPGKGCNLTAQFSIN